MLELAETSAKAFRQGALGQVRSVLWEPGARNDITGVWRGLTDNYVRVKTDSDRDLSNLITNARLIALDPDWVISEVVPL